MRSVLVVDDVADVRDLCRVILESLGCTVSEATSAEEAIANLSAAQPDYLVLDLGMPGMSGWELLARVRSEDAGGDSTRVIVCTAHGGPAEERRAFGEGAYAFLAKPFTPQDLIALVT